MISNAEMRSVSIIDPQDLTSYQIKQLRFMVDPSELGHIIRTALDQRPPNEKMAAFLSGICVGRLDQGNLTSIERDMLVSAAGNVAPEIEKYGIVAAAAR